MTAQTRPVDLRLVASNAGFLMAAQTVYGLVGLIRTALIARYLGPSGFGAWGYALAFVSLFASLGDFGLSTLAVRDVVTGQNAGRYYGTALALKAILSFLLLIVMMAMATALGSTASTRMLMYLMGLQMLLGSALVLGTTIFRVRERMELEALATIANSLSVIGVVVVLISVGASPVAMALGWVAATGAVLLLTLAVIVRWFRPRGICFDFRLAKRIFRDACGLSLAMAMGTIYYFFDRLLLGWFQEDAALGLYTAAYAPLLGVAALTGAVRVAFMPAQARSLADVDEAQSLSRVYAFATLGLGLPCAVAGLFLARPLLLAIYGTQYEGATLAMRVLSLDCPFLFMSSCLGAYAILAGRNGRYVKCVTSGAVANILLNLALIPLYSLNGAAVATVFSEALVALLLFWSVMDIVRPHVLLTAGHGPVLAAAVLACVLGLGAMIFPLTPVVVVAGLCYAVLLGQSARRLDAFRKTPQTLPRLPFRAA